MQHYAFQVDADFEVEQLAEDLLEADAVA